VPLLCDFKGAALVLALCFSLGFGYLLLASAKLALVCYFPLRSVHDCISFLVRLLAHCCVLERCHFLGDADCELPLGTHSPHMHTPLRSLSRALLNWL
jgi:hypothetical protein